MNIISWNVNGIRAVIKKGFLDWFQKENPDILCLQETKAFQTQLPQEVYSFFGDYDYVWHGGTIPGYAGTAIFFKKSIKFLEKKFSFDDISYFNDDGRVTEIRFILDNKEVVLLNIYFPNGGTRSDGTEMLTYKLAFYDKFLGYISKLRDEGKSIIVCGDFNICHRKIDIARPEANKNSIGFLPIEREKIGSVFQSGFIDVFRYFFPEIKDQYTRWSYRAGARHRNIGRRLDYFIVSSDLINKIKGIEHLINIMGSDHCPIKIEII